MIVPASKRMTLTLWLVQAKSRPLLSSQKSKAPCKNWRAGTLIFIAATVMARSASRYMLEGSEQCMHSDRHKTCGKESLEARQSRAKTSDTAA